MRNSSNPSRRRPGILQATQPLDEAVMPVFAFLYRPTRSLTPAEVAERARRIRAWALALRETGQILVVSAFDDDGGVLRQDGSVDGTADSSLAGCTLVDTPDRAAALTLARGFPGRAFGTDVEVRPVKTYLPPLTQ
jgi:hypothetical protein